MLNNILRLYKRENIEIKLGCARENLQIPRWKFANAKEKLCGSP